MTNPLLAPLLGLLGVLIGVVGNSLATSRREARTFAREKKLELYLDLQNEEYELRDRWRELWFDQPVEVDWSNVNARWASLQLRSRLFASRKIQELARSYYMQMSRWLRSAQRYIDDPDSADGSKDELNERAESILGVFSELYTEIRRDLGIQLAGPEDPNTPA